MAKRKTKKKAWKDFEVIKVKLNPEQAVLSCCNQLNAKAYQQFGGGMCITRAGDCDGATSTDIATSSS